LISGLDEASLSASITCSRPGADPPTRAEVETARADRPSTRQSASG
jgi:fructokinase